ncbi:mogroside IE synthase [Vitis vinifera]|uniref:Glycosyltransferase n=2 Tax=Vitis vinifera TaxID=29760 RepID=F6HAY5_VITVI|nr:mogroside IE synthase [Vitis vinifera]RVW74701.1 UDP-glycosyltransferase 74E1 [Vitis vinifera]|eukprot:XP_002275387.2 PREDICTED: UDP-glycosyltransferase 74E1 [Vitis vinifera]
MESDKRVSETHIMVLPFHAQGHINPMLQFSKRLASKGIKVTLVIAATSNSQSMHAQTSSINIEIISEEFDRRQQEESIEDYLERFRILASQGLTALMEKHNRSNHPAKLLIYDSVLPWAQDLAEHLGLDGVPFFTQSCAVSAIYYHFYQGVFNTPLEESTVSMPSMPLLRVDDLPSFINVKSPVDSALLNLVLSQFSNFKKGKWILCNTFDKLEDQVMKWMTSQRPLIKTIGPTVPSMYLDKRLEDDKDYGLSLFQQNVDTCITWLDTKGIGSVVYVSFGSLASLGEEQMEELAWGLKRSNSHFMWVVRELEKKKLPNNFIEETSEKGLVVSWCCQLEVLAHKAVGCFMTHCGWNSTLEALSLGVPMIAMPRFSDQTTNAKFVEDIWQVGVRVKADEKGIVKREEIEMCLSEIMEGERGYEMKRNAARWKELAKEAVNEGGSSDKNLEEFVAELLCSSD